MQIPRYGLILSFMLFISCAKMTEKASTLNTATQDLLQHSWTLKTAYDSVFTLSGNNSPLSQLIIGTTADSVRFSANGNEYVSGFTGFFVTGNSIGIGSSFGGVLQYPYALINNDKYIARFLQSGNVGSMIRDTSTIVFISSSMLVLEWVHVNSLNSEHVYDTLIR